MRTRAGKILLIVTTLAGVARAQTGMAATADDQSGLLPLMAMLIGACFAVLVFWGFTQSLLCFFPDSQIMPERRRLLRWIGLNFLEPSFTTGLMVFAFVRVQGATNNFLFLWFVLPLISFLSLLIALRFSSRDRLVQSALSSLRQVVLARFASVLIAASSLLVMQLWFTLLTGAFGVIIFGWSLQRLHRQVDLLWPINEAQIQQRHST